MRLLIGRRDDIPRTAARLRAQLSHEGRAALPFANPTCSTAAHGAHRVRWAPQFHLMLLIARDFFW